MLALRAPSMNGCWFAPKANAPMPILQCGERLALPEQGIDIE
jgi:hypothetical protein